MHSRLFYKFQRASVGYACGRNKDFCIIYGSREDYDLLERFGRSYSGVLAFEEYIEDDYFLREIFISFVSIVLAPGLDLSRSCIIATRHNEPITNDEGDVVGRRTAVHFNGYARDLLSGHVHGAHTSIRVHGLMRVFGRYVNALYGFTDPEISVRKELYNPYGSDLAEPIILKNRSLISRRDFRSYCESLALDQIEYGEIQCRADLIKVLERFSIILVATPRKIIIQIHEKEPPIKLTGSVFTLRGLYRAIQTAGFGKRENEEECARDVRGSCVSPEDKQRKLQALRTDLEKYYERAVKYAQGRLQRFHHRLKADLKTQLSKVTDDSHHLERDLNLCTARFPNFPKEPKGICGKCDRPPVPASEDRGYAGGFDVDGNEPGTKATDQYVEGKAEDPSGIRPARCLREALYASRSEALGSQYCGRVEAIKRSKRGKIDESETRKNNNARTWDNAIRGLRGLSDACCRIREACRRIRERIERIVERRRRAREFATGLAQTVDEVEQSLQRTRRAHAGYARSATKDDPRLETKD